MKSRSKYREARQIFVELVYQSSIWSKQLTELAEQLGFRNSSGITMMHNRVQEKMKSDRAFSKKIENLGKKL